MKNLLKELKLNESTISMALGTIVILIVGVALILQFRPTADSVDLSVASDTDIESIADTSSINGETSEVEQAGNYTVVAGDNLWNISEREYGTGYEWKKIAEANPEIGEDGQISVGQRISVPSASVASAEGQILDDGASTIATAPSVDDHEAPVASPEQYIVQRGDCLWKIADAVYGDGMRWSEIASLNNLANPSIIHSGNILKLPA